MSEEMKDHIWATVYAAALAAVIRNVGQFAVNDSHRRKCADEADAAVRFVEVPRG